MNRKVLVIAIETSKFQTQQNSLGTTLHFNKLANQIDDSCIIEYMTLDSGGNVIMNV